MKSTFAWRTYTTILDVGVTKAEYHKYTTTDGWRATRERAIQNAGLKCQTCGSAKGLTVHHKSYVNLGHEPDSDLQVVCKPCHLAIHRTLGLRYQGDAK